MAGVFVQSHVNGWTRLKSISEWMRSGPNVQALWYRVRVC